MSIIKYLDRWMKNTVDGITYTMWINGKRCKDGYNPDHEDLIVGFFCIEDEEAFD